MIKKTTILMFLSIALVSFTYAQKFSSGIKAGGNISTLMNIDDAESKTGFYAGAFVSSKFGPVGVQADFLFNRIGTKYKIPQLFDYNQETLHLDYLQFPIMVKLHPIPMINFQAGPYFGFLVNVEDEGNNLDTDDFKTADFGLKLGVGFEISRLVIEARYGM
ncbi:MAG: PorT family protein [Bacteroidales bacterium]|nr:PorT family protein [Bacteroidales bacterium]MCF8344493.1 PorT family protein [Bacteroidales bacterium]MCF8350996.1 PorT family protein [Bacteroidales bacterium]MCF8376120.1 PorT family protein [Bacteroidales bacterium]MCF8401433.1 PorT family protein [Bacteroidales bacterium]